MKVNILVGLTGSVATIKAGKLISHLISTLGDECCIQALLTRHAEHFLNKEQPFIPDTVKILRDEDEWLQWNGRGDPVLHIELCKWADLLVIAPLDANTLAKLANGLCDNLITCVFRAWQSQKKVLLCPAMNTQMWQNVMTRRHLDTLKDLYSNITILEPISKRLVCGDEGVGAMTETESIVDWIVTYLNDNKKTI